MDGAGTEIATTAYKNPYTYTARRADDETGLMYFRARYYDPATSEFISRDPLGYVDGMSLYRGYFVPGAVDPLGEATQQGISWTLNPFELFDLGGDEPYDLPHFDAWSTHTAKAKIDVMIAAMEQEENFYAAKLMKAWLAKTGAPPITKKDREQVAKDSSDWVQSKINWDMWVNPPDCPDEISNSLVSSRLGGSHYDEYFSAIQNVNLFFAFGNVGYKIDYVAKKKNQNMETGIFMQTCSCDYDVEYTVLFDDVFNFGKTFFGTRRNSPYYSAAYWLQSNKHAASFAHQITVSDSYSYTPTITQFR